jgi:uncharacterized membrane protein YeaQ/YmgE (transglycosylase-associated protein family)
MFLAQSALISLAAGFVLGIIGRWLLRSRVQISLAEATLCGIGGAIIGGGVAHMLMGRPDEATPLAAGLGALVGTAVILLVVDRVAWIRNKPRQSAGELVVAGESSRVEFKSTARYNLHSKQRDEKIELAIAKTVAAFANSAGGTLLIGVDDDGNALGLDKDLSLMKKADLDRYELWLGDFLGSTLGIVAASAIDVTFESLGGQDVCVVRVSPSTRPVFVTDKNKSRALFIRSGNSTRQLGTDEAIAYATRRWGGRALRRAAG